MHTKETITLPRDRPLQSSVRLSNKYIYSKLRDRDEWDMPTYSGWEHKSTVVGSAQSGRGQLLRGWGP